MLRYHAKTVDKGAAAIVQALLLDYPRREALTAALGTIDHESDLKNIKAFCLWNERIDGVFQTIDEPLRDGLFQDIAKGRGWTKSPPTATAKPQRILSSEKHPAFAFGKSALYRGIKHDARQKQLYQNSF